MLNEVKKYMRGKIYKIVNELNSEIYIGLTTQHLNTRMGQHIADAFKNENKHKPLYKMMNEIGYKSFSIELIKDFPCASRFFLEQEENKFITKIGTLNMKMNIKEQETKQNIKKIAKQNVKKTSKISNNDIMMCKNIIENIIKDVFNVQKKDKTCNRCCVLYGMDMFSKKANGSYYTSCNECESKNKTYYDNKKEDIKHIHKIINQKIECECGKTIQCYNSSHYSQHIRSIYHQKYKNMLIKNNNILTPISKKIEL